MIERVVDLVPVVRENLGPDPWIVALGGGADSAVLLAACAAARPQQLRAVFVNHGLEGSATLREQVELLVARLGVDLIIVDAIVPEGPDLELRARTARYLAIESVLGEGAVCATAHTSDDQAETVLMRIARGSGSAGLAGIPAVRGPFRRPMLGLSRAELRAIAIRESLPFADDPANSDERFLRSRIRTQALPVLEHAFGSDIRVNLARSAALVGDDDRELTLMASRIPVLASEIGGQWTVAVPAAALVTSPSPVATRAIRQALKVFNHPYRGTHDDVVAVLASAADGGQRIVAGDVVCAVEQGMVVLTDKRTPPIPSAIAVTVGSPVVWGRHRYSVSRSDRPSLMSTSGRRTAVVDSDAAIGFRAVADGDRIEIEGGRARVVEVLRSAGVPARLRPGWLAITINGKIAAVHGIRVAPWAKPIVGESAVIIEREGSL